MFFHDCIPLSDTAISLDAQASLQKLNQTSIVLYGLILWGFISPNPFSDYLSFTKHP
jgi:hypothetical protein